MTVEEALLAVVGAIALVLLFLGLSEVLEGDPLARLRARRRLVRRGQPRPSEDAAGRSPLARRLSVTRVGAADEADSAPAEASAAGPVPIPGGHPRPASVETPAGDRVGEDWRERVATLIRQREVAEARRLIEPAIASGAVGPQTLAFLLEVSSITIARELWRFRRETRRGAGDEVRLAGSMETARGLLDSELVSRVPAALRRGIARRLWRGHTRLGLRRWRGGEFDGAVEALFQAVGVLGIDERRRRLARDLLVRTLEDLAGQSLELIPQLLGDGERDAARERAHRELARIRRARDEGVPAEDLAVAASRIRQLLEHIEQAPVR